MTAVVSREPAACARIASDSGTPRRADRKRLVAGYGPERRRDPARQLPRDAVASVSTSSDVLAEWRRARGKLLHVGHYCHVTKVDGERKTDGGTDHRVVFGDEQMQLCEEFAGVLAHRDRDSQRSSNGSMVMQNRIA